MNYSDQAQTALNTSILIGTVVGLVSLIFAVIIYWKIFSKAGYSGALSLLMFIPIANLIILCVLAFGDWPIHRELRELRQRVGMGVRQPY